MKGRNCRELDRPWFVSPLQGSWKLPLADPGRCPGLYC